MTVPDEKGHRTAAPAAYLASALEEVRDEFGESLARISEVMSATPADLEAAASSLRAMGVSAVWAGPLVASVVHAQVEEQKRIQQNVLKESGVLVPADLDLSSLASLVPFAPELPRPVPPSAGRRTRYTAPDPVIRQRKTARRNARLQRRKGRK